MAYIDDEGQDIPPGILPPNDWTYRLPPGERPVPSDSIVSDDAALLQDMASRQGVIPGSTDLANLAAKHPEDRAAYIAALGEQYRLRGASNGGGGQSVVSAGGVSGAPQSMQPYGPFSFDFSKVGQSEGFKFKFDRAMEAIKRIGAAKGSYFNPQTWKAMQEEATGLASADINDEYARQAGVYDRNFGTHGWNETSRYNSQRANRMDDWGIMDSDRRFNRGVFESDRGFNRGVFESDRGFDYGRERDRVDDEFRFIDYGYNSARNPR